jgi:hypothetical protein
MVRRGIQGDKKPNKTIKSLNQAYSLLVEWKGKARCQNRSGRREHEKNRDSNPSPGQPVASRYTDCAVPAPTLCAMDVLALLLILFIDW